MRLRSVLQICLMLAPGPAFADEYFGFQSPTGNIHCSIHDYQGVTTARCDLAELVPSHTKPPQNCELDWGATFAVDERGLGYLGCVGDTVRDRSNPVLGYGQAVSLGGISCVSARTGMTCTNAGGHGFSVAKARQRLY